MKLKSFLQKQTQNLKKIKDEKLVNLKKNKPKDEDDEIGIGTKVKVITALLVVGLAAYIAFWVQEPADVSIDVMSATEDALISESMEVAQAEDYPVIAEVSIVDFTFTPANMTVEEGTTVVWTNLDPVDHTVTAETFSSGTLEPGDSFSFDFEEVGEYEYTCSFHPAMTGKITVSPKEEAPVVDLDAGLEEDMPVSGEIAEDFLTSLDEDIQPESVDLLTVEDVDLVTETETNEAAVETPRIITFDAEELMAEEEALHEAAQVADESDKLAKTGPEDIIYAGIFIAILYFNRRKIFAAAR